MCCPPWLETEVDRAPLSNRHSLRLLNHPKPPSLLEIAGFRLNSALILVADLWTVELCPGWLWMMRLMTTALIKSHAPTSHQGLGLKA